MFLQCCCDCIHNFHVMIMRLAVTSDDSKFMLLPDLGMRVVTKSTFCRLWRQLVLSALGLWLISSLVLFVFEKKTQFSSNIIVIYYWCNMQCRTSATTSALQKQSLTIASDGTETLICRKPCSNDFTMHYSFYFAQQVHYPSSPLQLGPNVFLVPRKCGVFGVCCEALP